MTKARRRQITVPPKESLPKTLDFAKVDATCGACLLDLWDSLQSGTHADESLVAAIPHCNHLFHWTCLQTWTNQENSCPLCKKRFGTIGKYNHINGDLISKHVVQWKDFSEDEDSGGDDPLELCEKCHEPGMEFIYCDGMNGTCNSPFHLKCAKLKSVPKGQWFCPYCIEHGHGPKEKPKEKPKPKPKARKVRQVQIYKSIELPEEKPLPLGPAPTPASALRSSALPKIFLQQSQIEATIETLQKIAGAPEPRTSILAEIRERRKRMHSSFS